VEYRASDTGSENLRRVEVDDVGRKDFMFGATGVGLMIVVAIVLAIVA
jgi:hypothetical protein